MIFNPTTAHPHFAVCSATANSFDVLRLKVIARGIAGRIRIHENPGKPEAAIYIEEI